MNYYYPILIITLVAGVFAIGQWWFGGRPDPLIARYRFTMGLVYVMSVLMLAQSVCLFILPNLLSFKPQRPETLLLVFVVTLAIHFQFSSRLKEREKNK